MNKFRDRFIHAHGFLYIVRGTPGHYVIFTGRKLVSAQTPLRTAAEVRTLIKRHALERLRSCLTT